MEFRFDRPVEIGNFHNASVEELHAMAAMTGLASRLRDAARRALSSR